MGVRRRPRLGESSGRLLVIASALQLASGLAGLTLGVRRRHAYDWLFLHGDPDRMGLEAVTHGTGLSAPVPMLVSQLGATWLLARGQGAGRARVTLGLLGAMMVPGYLGERIVRERLSRAGWDPIESPVVAAGVALAAAMTMLAWPAGHAAGDAVAGQVEQVAR